MATKKLSADDQFEIQNVLNRYCFTVDHDECDAFAALFTEDGEFGSNTMDKPFRGRSELHPVPSLTRQYQGENLRHQITNVISEAGEKEGEARIRCYGLVTDWANGGKNLCFAEYRMSLVKLDGEWKIKRNDAVVMQA